MDCALSDAIELACVQQAGVRLRTSDGQSLSGKALDIRSDGSDEFLVLSAPGRRLLVRLRAIVSLETAGLCMNQGGVSRSPTTTGS